MKAWEMEKELMEGSKPKVLTEEEQTWNQIEALEKEEDSKIKLLWYSEVPGSGARERLIVGAIQAAGNKGLDVSEAEKWIPLGIEAHKKNDMIQLNQITCRIFHELNQAKKDIKAPYWNYKIYNTWDMYLEDADFIDGIEYDISSKDFEDKTYWGWMAQICGGAFGTAIEGYTTKNLREAFSEIKSYVRQPNTFNDDITYELAFLKAFEETGLDISAKDIAEKWVGYIPFGWSAEDIALKNIKLGIYPPESGCLNNPFNEWIGAQMRGAICGMAAPGNPKKAAKFAWEDGIVSHFNNGVIGEIFNATMVALSFVRNDVRALLNEAIDMIPKQSEYYTVVQYAYEKCVNAQSWEDAWASCEKKYEKYNWIHAYPNAAAEVVALWFGNGNFDETMHIIGMAGQDVDCNAAQIASVLGIMFGSETITDKWTKPIGDELNTYVRSLKEIKISNLAQWTVQVVREAYSK